jgi:uncharacterized protein YbaP (TraB family)
MYLQVLDTNIRLFGSLHRFPDAALELPAWATEAYEWSEALVLESDLSAALPFFKSIEKTNLQSLLEPEVWTMLTSIWPAEGPVSPLSSIRPWAIWLLAQSFCIKTSSGVEPRFIQWANQHSKPLTFLETAKEFADALEAVPLEEILTALKVLASDFSSAQKILDDFYAAWLSRDIEAVYAAASQSPTFAYPGLRYALLESRNRAWAAVVQKMLKTDRRTLIVVGALHLCGPKNLVQLLGQKTAPV